MQPEELFFSANKARDWRRGIGFNLDVSEQGLKIAATSKYNVIHSMTLGEQSGRGRVISFALEQGKHMYVLREDLSLWVMDYENQYQEQLFSTDHGHYTSSAFITAADGTIVIADPHAERKIAAYSASNGQALWEWNEFGGQELFPLALASHDHGVFYALIPLGIAPGEIHIPEETPLSLLRIEKSGHISRTIVHPKLKSKGSRNLDSERSGYQLAVSDQIVYVFDLANNMLITLHEDREELTMLNLPSSLQCSGVAADSHGNVYIGDSRELAEGEEDDRHMMIFSGMGQSITSMSGFRGRVDVLLIDGDERLYALDRREGLLTILELKRRTQMLEYTGLPHAIYLSGCFDSTSTETEWHKIATEATIPEETQILVSFYASDRRELMIDGQWIDLERYIQDPDIHPYMKLYSLSSIWSEPIVNPTDALLFQAKGRYIWFRIELIGSERKSPELHRLRIHFPRTSYLQYLPEVYQQDEKSRDFLERFLALFETFFQQIDGQIRGLPRFFDPDAVEGEYLQWLATWLGIAREGRWSDAQLREIIRIAPQLYRKRGTREAIEHWVRIFTGEAPMILEYHEWKNMDESAQLKQAMAHLYGTQPNSFCVLVKPDLVQTEDQRKTLQKILDEEKPAFTEAKLFVMQPWMYMDMHTYLGVNTTLSEPKLLSLDEKSSLPYNTVIIDLDRDRRLDIHTRLELDSELE